MRLFVDYGKHLMALNKEQSKAMCMLKETGFDGIDYNMQSFQMGDDYLENARQARAWLDEAGLCCVQCHAPNNFIYGGAMDFTNTIYRDNYRAIEFAEIIGARYLVIHGCSKVPDGPNSGQFVEYNYLYFKSFEEEAKRRRLFIGIENLKDTQFPNQAMVNKVVNLLDPSVFYPHVDFGHAMLNGIQPADFLRGINCGPVRAVHIHDYNIQTDHMLPYLGKTKWKDTIKALVDIGFDGDISFEIFQTMKLVQQYDAELLPALYRLVAAIGRYLIRQVEEERKGRVRQ